MKRTKTGVLATLLIIVVMALTVLTAGCKSAATINLEKLVDVEFTGYNGYGKAEINGARFTEAVMDALYKNKILESDSFMGQLVAAEKHPEIIDATDVNSICSLDVTEGLSNGDKVVLTFNYDNDRYKDVGIRFKGSSVTLEVSGLEEVDAFDPFEGIVVEFDGYSGYGSAHIANNPSNGLNYYLDSAEGLKNGDSVKVAASIPGYMTLDEYAEKYGAIPESYGKDFPVEGLAEVEEFDAFEGLEINYEGYAPRAKAKLSSPSHRDLRFNAEPAENLKNGDKITVTISGYNTGWLSTSSDFSAYAKSNGKIPAEFTKEFVVSDLPEYVTSFDQITDEVWDKIMDELRDQKAARIDIETFVHNYPLFEGKPAYAIPNKYIKNFKFYKAYLITPKSSEVKLMNRLMILYSCDVEGYTPSPIEGYYSGGKNIVGAFYIDGLYKGADGEILIPSTEIEYTNAYKGEDWFVNEFISKYRANYVIEDMALNVIP